MYSESHFPWFALLILLGPVILIPVIIQTAQPLFDHEAALEDIGVDVNDEDSEISPQELAAANSSRIKRIIGMSLVTVLLLWIFLSIRKYQIEANGLGIRFGYLGIWGKRVSRQDIARAYPTECRFSEFLGLGIRFGFRSKRWGYVCWFGDGVHIERTNGKKYAFSCHDPKACIAALNLSEEQKTPTEEDEV